MRRLGTRERNVANVSGTSKLTSPRWALFASPLYGSASPPPSPTGASRQQRLSDARLGAALPGRDLHRHIASPADHDRVRHHSDVALLQMRLVLLLLLVDRVEVRHRAPPRTRRLSRTVSCAYKPCSATTTTTTPPRVVRARAHLLPSSRLAGQVVVVAGRQRRRRQRRRLRRRAALSRARPSRSHPRRDGAFPARRHARSAAIVARDDHLHRETDGPDALSRTTTIMAVAVPSTAYCVYVTSLAPPITDAARRALRRSAECGSVHGSSISSPRSGFSSDSRSANDQRRGVTV